MKVLVCCIGKNENQYVREYVEWYKKLGVDHICLYDNNDVDGEHFEDVIGDEINDGFVILKNYRGKKVCQLEAYQECYDTYGGDYEWIAFFDCDEFLKLVKNQTIDQYLGRIIFKKADAIHINWMTIGDNGLVRDDGRMVTTRFTKPVSYDKKIAYDFPENYHVKTILRGGLSGVTWTSPVNVHTPNASGKKCVDASGFATKMDSPFSVYNYSDAILVHYTTKTAEEYARKMQRGFPDQMWDGSRVKNLIETRFFRTNDVTKEKIDVFKEKLGIDMQYLLKDSSKSDDVKIYSLCYSKKDFEFLDDKVVTPLQVGAANGTDVCELKDNTGDNISSANFFYIENTGTYWIYRNVKNCKYKGQMQYRRPLSGINETFDFDKAFENYDVITCEPFNHPSNNKPTKENNYTCIPADTVEGGYAFSNCIVDLEILESVIKEQFPEYSEDYDKYIKHGENLYYSNGFVLREADFDRYAGFLFRALNGWLSKAGIQSMSDLYYHVGFNMGAGKYIRYKNPNEVPMAAVKWQTEIGGFLAERIWTLWLLHNYSTDRILTKPYIKMEEGMYT